MGFNRPEAKRLAKAAMRNTNPNPMLVTLVFVLLTTGVSYLVGLVLTNPIYDALYTAYLYLLDGAYDPMFIFKSLLSPGMVAVYMLVSLLLNVYFWVMNFGYASYALRMARGEQPGYRRLFDGFAALGRAILVSLLTSIFLSLWGLLFMVPYMVVMILAALLGSMGLMMLAILLLIGGMVMMVIFSYRYRLATYFLLDHPEMGALESITQSKQAMKGWKGELFILDWSFFGWLLLVALVELVGIGLGTLFSPALGTLLGTDTASLHFATAANKIGNGLDEQLENFIKEHPDTKLVIIDTMQKIRETGGEAYSYASDYEIIGKLKRFADRHSICTKK